MRITCSQFDSLFPLTFVLLMWYLLRRVLVLPRGSIEHLLRVSEEKGDEKHSNMLRSELLKARNSDVGFATEKRGRARAVDGDVRRQQWWQRAARWVRAHGTHAIPYVRFDHETNGAVILPELFSSEVRSVGLNFNLCIRIVISFFFVENPSQFFARSPPRWNTLVYLPPPRCGVSASTTACSFRSA